MAVDQELFELQVEGDPAGLSTVRGFVRALARSVDADAERSDDIQLIVSEICTELLESGGRLLHVVVRRQTGALDLTVEGPGAELSGDGEQRAFRRALLQTLSPDATWGPSSARFTVSVADPAPQDR